MKVHGCGHLSLQASVSNETAIELQPSYALDIHKEIGCAGDAKFNANVRLLF
jgi:hypothetical protein